MVADPEEVEKRTELIKARGVAIGAKLGGLEIVSGDDLEKMAARIARGGIAVPAHCRDQPGVVHTLMLQALEWGMPFMSVISKSYVPRGGDRVGYESQLIHAVIEKNAKLKKRMRFEMGHLVDGKWVEDKIEDDQRRCKVIATFEGEETPHEYTSQTLAKLHPGHITKDGVQYVKGSQMWDDDPDVQMFYATSRQWARLYCPDVLLGAYTPEELQRGGMKDVTPVMSEAEKFAQRLKEKNLEHVRGRGFDADGIRAAIIEGDTNPGVAQHGETYGEEETGIAGNDEAGVRDSVGSADDPDRGQPDNAGAGQRDDRAVGEAAGGSAVANIAKDQAEIFPPDRKPVARPKGKKR